MALIKCPECEKEISDKAESCPNCGCPISNKKEETAINTTQNAVHSNNVEFVKMEITTIPKKPLIGILNLIVGAFLFILVPISLFIFPVIGILGAIGGVIGGAALIRAGVLNLKGSIQKSYCPYCNKQIEFSENETYIKCPYCKQTSIKRDNYIIPTKK